MAAAAAVVSVVRRLRLPPLVNRDADAAVTAASADDGVGSQYTLMRADVPVVRCCAEGWSPQSSLTKRSLGTVTTVGVAHFLLNQILKLVKYFILSAHS